MNTKDKRLTEVYYDIMNDRSKEAETVKKSDIVENRHGARFTVEGISKSFDEVKEFDKTGECASYMKYSKRIDENTHWVGVRDKFNDLYVYPYNDDGVRFIESANTAETTYKGHNTMVEAYNAVLKGEETVVTEEKDVNIEE